MDIQSIGLRERKRIETRTNLELAAIQLVAKHGLEQTTIDMICDQADVSKRTFFNYFDSKEDAILGLHDIEISDELLQDHANTHNDSDWIASIVDLLLLVTGPRITDPTLRQARLKVIQQHPKLAERQMDRMIHVSTQFTDAIERISVMQNRTPVTAAQAKILLALCGSSFRIAIKEWAATGKPMSLPDVQKRSLTLIREVLEII